MKHLIIYIAALCSLTANAAGRLPLQDGKAGVKVTFGLKTNVRQWDGSARLVSVSGARKVTEDYSLLVGKQRQCHKVGTERIYTLVNSGSDTLLLHFRSYRDGYAFAYSLPHAKPGEEITDELTTYSLTAVNNRWLQKYDGPGYEHYYDSPDADRYGQPSLFQVSDSRYVLLTESDVMHGDCGSVIAPVKSATDSYKVQLLSPMTAENANKTPWRVVITGSLADVVQSTLVTDVATPALLDDTSWIETGLSSWIYWAHNHGSQDYNILKQYVDFAAEMHWPYTLIDAEWDVMRGGSIEDIVKYAVSKGVKPMIWYNSSTNWVGKWAPTPQWLLNNPTDCDREFEKIAAWGVAGVKIDFFREDNAETMNYYLRLLECAAKHHLLVNFHGGTIPRGWQRTYPNLISCESVLGAEWYNNNGILTNRAAAHNATLPFTRNVIGSMDYTPGTFTDSQHPHITTHAHELALPILFESGIQHMPDRPEAYLSLPKEVKEMLMQLPSTWDETRLLAGYPGKSCVMARRKGNRWYVAGINGTDEAQTITFSLPREMKGNALLVTDGETQTSFCINPSAALKHKHSIVCKPRGGFVITTP